MKCIPMALFVGALAAASMAQVVEMSYTTSPADHLGPEQGVMRRDPSDIIKVGGLYYVWYSRGPQPDGYNATVWYATSVDGHTWAERAEALARGPKGSWDEQSVFTFKLGVAIADQPEGPYAKNPNNPIVGGGHEVLVWPYGTGVVAMINIGPTGVRRTLQYARDGLSFARMADLKHVPSAPGAYRPEAFTDSGKGKMIRWGVHIGRKKGCLPFLERFDYTWKVERTAEPSAGGGAPGPAS